MKNTLKHSNVSLFFCFFFYMTPNNPQNPIPPQQNTLQYQISQQNMAQYQMPQQNALQYQPMHTLVYGYPNTFSLALNPAPICFYISPITIQMSAIAAVGLLWLASVSLSLNKDKYIAAVTTSAGALAVFCYLKYGMM